LRKNKSAIKKAMQAETRRLRNSHIKSTMKTYVKKVATAIAEGPDTQRLEASLREAIAYISKAASKGVIHGNAASRKVSRLSKKVYKVLQPKS
jgi:small subunit ribosomal protein S20